MAIQRRLILVAVAVSIALHGMAIVGTPRFDLAWLYKEAEAPPLQVEIVLPPPPAPVPQVVPRPKPKSKPQSAPSQTQARQVQPPQPAPDVVHDPQMLSSDSPDPSPLNGEASAAQGSEAHAVGAVEAVRTPLAYPVRSARLVFDLYYGESKTLVGEVVQTWELSGDRYVTESSAEAIGFVSLFLGGRYVQRSEGTLGPDGFVPQIYSLRDRGREKPERVTFDWKAGTVHFHRRGTKREAELPPGTQDPLSAVHQLYFLRPLAPGLLIDVATTRKTETMLFQNMGIDEVTTASGPRDAVHIKRQDLDGAITEVWLDPARSFLPVRIYTLNRNGYVLDQILREAAVEPNVSPDSAASAAPE